VGFEQNCFVLVFRIFIRHLRPSNVTVPSCLSYIPIVPQGVREHHAIYSACLRIRSADVLTKFAEIAV
jgi:hypothetical protein